MKLEKITEQEKAGPKRRYDDACAVAHGMDLIGDRWAFLVMRELMLGPKRFSDIREGLAGISANVLTQRLEGLEESGIIRRRRLPPPVSAQVYELTPWGQESAMVMRVLARWAARSPGHDPSLPFSAVSLALSLRTMFEPARAGDMTARIVFETEQETLVATLAAGALKVVRGETGEADVTVAGPPRAVAAAIYGGVPAADLIATGELKVAGDMAVLSRFVTLFPLPDKVESGG
ncbi:winged helix-turn-helix transcriptional regulator [Phreatobacter sp.]|uniref:winged helix-turn-helix transcriptional regulator n=1 Tax=Phreatobacter sp. TaxID=1966341 RepID=UPI003F6E6377